MTRTENEWFATWFDSPYYPIMYRHRDEEEARMALENLTSWLKLQTGADVLDLCCGQGRHSRTLSDLGYIVTGIDLSPASIEVAKKLSSSNQQFEIQDMRSFEVNKHFDAVLNLFTSFGYFDNRTENLRVLDRIGVHLKPGGWLVIDYLNAFPLFQQEEESRNEQVDSILFHTRKFRENDTIVKLIEVHDEGDVFRFREQVQLITLNDFQNMLAQTGFEVIQTFGNYRLEDYRPETSERCIIIARKS